MRWAPLVPCLALCALAAPGAAADDEKPAARIVRTEHVVRLVVDAYVTDAKGDPITDLVASDFRVLSDGKPLEVESVEFVAAGSSGGARGAAAGPGGRRRRPRRRRIRPGRLIVLFLEGDLGRQRTKGLMRVRQEIHRLLDRLLPTDRVAVVRFYSHLTVLADFTNDRAVLDAALRLGLGSSRDADVRVSPYPSLAANLDFGEARKAAHVERALELVAAALAPIPGAKAVIFAGWGFFANRAPIEGDLYERALGALMRARANVFMLDTSDADWHTLETTLQTASEVTGGTYAKTHIFAGQAVERVARALAGRWVIVCIAPDAAPAHPRRHARGPARRRRRAGVHCAAMMRFRAAARAAIALAAVTALSSGCASGPSASASPPRPRPRPRRLRPGRGEEAHRSRRDEGTRPGDGSLRAAPHLGGERPGPRRPRGRAPLRRPPRGRRGAGRGVGRVPPRLSRPTSTSASSCLRAP